jgi:hypothetical protein
MSLLSTDITKVNRLSLREVKLPAPERRVERPPTEEEIAYSRLVAISPLIEELVECLDLVGNNSREVIRKVRTPTDYKALNPQETVKDEVIGLMKEIIDLDTTYPKEYIISKIEETAIVDKTRAERGFNLILQAGAIEITQEGSYVLTGSKITQINTVNIII